MGAAVDHAVIATRDLEASAAAFERLGFTVAARGVHPWGTWNRVVQLADRSFLELLAVGEPEKIVEAEPGGFSFGAFNRDFLRGGEGMSMLALASTDAVMTRERFAEAGLPVFPLFRFGRTAVGPDGGERPLAFRLAFTVDPGLPRAGVFACEHEHPENFWRADLARHANGVVGLVAVTMVAEDPADHHVFLSAATGCRDYKSSGFGLSFGLEGAALDVLTPEAFQHRFGQAAGYHFDARFRALTFRTADLAATERMLRAAGVAAERHGTLLVLPPERALTMAFTAD